MRRHEKPWALYASVRPMSWGCTAWRAGGAGDQLGVAGPEGRDSQYGKLKGTDTRELVRLFQDTASACWGSSIIGWRSIPRPTSTRPSAYAVSHDTVFQPVHAVHVGGGHASARRARGLGCCWVGGKEEIGLEDTHRQFRFNFRHAHITEGQEDGVPSPAAVARRISA